MKKRIFGLFLALSLITVAICAPVTVSAVEPEAYKTFLQTGFDSLTEWSGAGTGGGAITYANPEGVGTLTLDGWTANTTLNSKDAIVPASDANKKIEGTYFPSVDTDKALEAKYVTADTGNYYFYNNFDLGEDGILKISVNFLVSSSTNSTHNFLTCELKNRNNTTSSNLLFSVRQQQAANNAAIQVNIKGSTVNASGYSLNKWNNITVLINTEDKTFSFSLNGNVITGLEKVDLQKKDTLTFFGTDNTTKLDQIKFATVKNAVNNDCIYIDDIFFGREATAFSAPAFVKTTNIENAVNTDIDNIRQDLKSVTVAFSQAMNEKSLSKYVSLTKSDGTVVDFTGEYNADAYEYTAVLDDVASSNTVYNLNFNKGVRTQDNIMLNTPLSFDFETKVEPFAITDLFFSRTSDPETKIANISGEIEYSGTSSKIYANAKVDYTKQMSENKEVTVIAALYKKDGNLKMIDVKADGITVTTENGVQTKNVQAELDLDGIDMSEIREAYVFAWDNSNTLRPLANKVISPVAVDLSGYTILYKNNFESYDDGAAAGCGNENMSSAASFGVYDAPDAKQGKAMKLTHASGVNTGMPWFWFTLSEPQRSSENSTFVIDYKLYSVNGSAPFAFSYMVGSAPINFLAYRPNKDLQNSKNAVIGKYDTEDWEQYRIVIKMSATGNTYDVYQNGELICSEASIGAVTDVTSNIRITYAQSGNTANPSIAYLDDIIIYKYDGTFLTPNALN